MNLSPPLPLSDAISVDWTDEEVCKSLVTMIDGSRLPKNVIARNPCPYEPSNLPSGIWYFLPRGIQKEGGTGLWKTKGEPCIIFVSPVITGWRTTYKYCDAQGPNEPKTEWVMQEYRVTKEKHGKNCPKDAGSLCSVFVSSVDGSYLSGLIGEENNRNGQGSTIRSNESNREDENIRIAVADGLLNQPVEDQPGFDDGDFMELSDLDIPAHPSSSSESCISMDSDECFDSFAFLLDLEPESRLCILAPVRLTEVVMHPETAGPLTTAIGNNRPAEVHETVGLPPGSATKSKSQDPTVLEPFFNGEKGKNVVGVSVSKLHAGTALKPSITGAKIENDGGGPPSNLHNAEASSSGHKSAIVRRKGGGVGLKKFFSCILI